MVRRLLLYAADHLTEVSSSAFDHSALFTSTRYLVCVNGSLEADRAVELSLRHAKAGDELHLLYVHLPLDSAARPPHVSHDAWMHEDAKKAERMKSLLDQYRVRLEGAHKQIRTKAVYAEGPLLKKIVEAVDTCDVDVLVLSRHHYSHSKEEYAYADCCVSVALILECSNKLGLGHDAHEIVQHCSCSVLVVK